MRRSVSLRQSDVTSPLEDVYILERYDEQSCGWACNVRVIKSILFRRKIFFRWNIFQTAGFLVEWPLK